MEMAKYFKVIILVCCALGLFCNVIAKKYFITPQNNRIIILQQVAKAARGGHYIKKEKASSPVVVGDEFQKVKAGLPSAATFTRHVALIAALVEKHRLQVEQNLVFEPIETEHPELQGFRASISVQGSYAGVKKLLAEIQNIAGISYIDKLKMSRVKEGRNRIKMDANLVIFFRQGAA